MSPKQAVFVYLARPKPQALESQTLRTQGPSPKPQMWFSRLGMLGLGLASGADEKFDEAVGLAAFCGQGLQKLPTLFRASSFIYLYQNIPEIDSRLKRRGRLLRPP